MLCKLIIVIPTFNRRLITQQAVIDICAGSNVSFDMLICDSGSTDGTPDAFSARQNITVINVGAKAWWTAAVNRGVEYGLKQNHYDYVLILNDDVHTPLTLIEQLLNAAKEHPLKIISPAQKSATGFFLGMTYSKLLKNFKVIYADQVTQPTEVHSTNGCCLLIPIEVFKTVGLFDEVNCPQLAADVEFQLRARKHGFATIACPDIVITQHANTDYYRKLNLTSLLTYEGSPVHLAAYLAHGRTLFNGSLKFAVLGFRYHYRYIKGLVKAVLSCVKGA